LGEIEKEPRDQTTPFLLIFSFFLLVLSSPFSLFFLFVPFPFLFTEPRQRTRERTRETQRESDSERRTERGKPPERRNPDPISDEQRRDFRWFWPEIWQLPGEIFR
jgi:hypothetical protein